MLSYEVSYEVGRNHNQKVEDYSYNICASITLISVSCQTAYCCSSKDSNQIWVRVITLYISQ